MNWTRIGDMIGFSLFQHALVSGNEGVREGPYRVYAL